MIQSGGRRQVCLNPHPRVAAAIAAAADRKEVEYEQHLPRHDKTCWMVGPVSRWSRVQARGRGHAGRHAFLVSKEFSISCQETGPMHHSGRRNVKGHPATGGPA